MANQDAREGRTDTAHTRDGTPISYRVDGREAGPRLALVHSLAMDKHFWDRAIAELGDRASVLTFDCRGHGRSGKPVGPYDVRQFADDLADLMDHVGWTGAAVAGASMGGCVALALAHRHPERVTGLGLFDTTSWYGETAVQAWDERARKAQDEGLEALVGFQATRWFNDGFREAHPEVLEAAIRVFLANDVDAYAASCRMLGDVDLRDALDGLDLPCRILVGSEDYATPPSMAEVLAERIKGATLTVLPGARHFTPLEAPAAIAGQLDALLRSHG
ncbi:alpha/beta fold hydrolase [Marinivivus vitaminiproducens]|uniref:alpha/beta fold hydrolase n=1 Tax=Marinivivus vitaminiproducens TaxID=3035935 RepID=UPI0027A5D354|nr:alpha/beta hydrolase [Geminicoccaceae bacterium SCSIO 64248]